MQYEEFLVPYHDDERRHVTYDGPQAETLHKADQWSDYFSDQLYDYFDGTFEVTSDIPRSISGYTNWTRQELIPIQKSVLEVRSQRSAHLATRLNFHTLSAAFLPQWIELLSNKEGYDTTHMSRADASYAQNFLAMEALDILKRREKIPVDEYYAKNDGKTSLQRDVYEGILTELDAGIVILEYTKSNPNLIALPSPSLFEHGDKSDRNSDFLLIDRQTKDVIGIQVKSYVDDGVVNHYDSNRITFIDGNIDFDNISQRAGKLRYVKATAGLVSASHLQNMSTNRNKRSDGALFLPDNRAILQAKLYARQVVTGNQQTALAQITRKINSRLSNALYTTQLQSN